MTELQKEIHEIIMETHRSYNANAAVMGFDKKDPFKKCKGCELDFVSCDFVPSACEDKK